MNDRTDHSHPDSAERTISLAPDLPAIPERLLLAHARGDVLFLCGAGVSTSAGLSLRSLLNSDSPRSPTLPSIDSDVSLAVCTCIQ